MFYKISLNAKYLHLYLRTFAPNNSTINHGNITILFGWTMFRTRVTKNKTFVFKIQQEKWE